MQISTQSTTVRNCVNVIAETDAAKSLDKLHKNHALGRNVEPSLMSAPNDKHSDHLSKIVEANILQNQTHYVDDTCVQVAENLYQEFSSMNGLAYLSQFPGAVEAVTKPLTEYEIETPITFEQVQRDVEISRTRMSEISTKIAQFQSISEHFNGQQNSIDYIANARLSRLESKPIDVQVESLSVQQRQALDRVRALARAQHSLSNN